MTVAERQQELAERQRALAPKEDLAPYKGLWVALRDGHVVARAVDAATLADAPEVQESDVLLHVEHGANANVL